MSLDITSYRFLLLAFMTMPLVAIFFQLVFRRRYKLVKWTTLLGMTLQLLLLALLAKYHREFVPIGFGPILEQTWIASLGIKITLGVDAVTLPYLMISAILAPLIYLLIMPLYKHEKYFLNSLLYQILLFGMYGSFIILDLVLFYLFWELVLIPIFIMVGMSRSNDRQAALMKFFLYSLAGSLLMLIGIIILGLNSQSGLTEPGFSFLNLKYSLLPWNAQEPFSNLQWWVCVSFLIAFFVKGHIFPLHSWLPDLYLKGTPLATISVAALLFNMATYAMIRFLPVLFPQALAWWSYPLMILGCAGILHGAFCVLMQRDLRNIVAYMSVSHVGFFLLGFATLTSSGLQAAYIQTINHAVLAAGYVGLALLLGKNEGDYSLENFSGLAQKVPVLATVFFIMTLANIGLPGTNGFVGEFLVLMSSFQKASWVTAIACLGVIFSATYGLKIYQQLFFKTNNSVNSSHDDLRGQSLFIFALLVFLVFLLGIKPMNFFAPAVQGLHDLITAVVL